jgi:undecaprenyl-diphosphatase
MSIIEAIILGLVQGLTEFIPVSSSGHLVLLQHAFGVTSAGLTFDVALHIGTLLALVLFFHKDIKLLFQGVFGKNKYTKVARLIVLATIPAVVFGIFLAGPAETTFRNVPLVSINLIGVAIIMLAAERYALRHKHKTQVNDITVKQAVLVGFAQAAALVPGVSRSGGTITAGLFAGLDRVAATRFSFLLAIPITFGAIVKVFAADGAWQQVDNDLTIFTVGIITAFLSGLFAIRFMLKFLSKHSLATFAYYRIAVGVSALVVWFFF